MGGGKSVLYCAQNLDEHSMIRVAINGFGRIGRTALKVGWGRPDIEFVAVNDLTEPAVLAHLLKYDSVFGRWPYEVEETSGGLLIDGVHLPVIAEKDPAKLPWSDFSVDVVIESTGRFTKQEDAAKHLTAGAKRVIISAPAKDIPTVLMGVNHTEHTSENIVNNASCTTNSIAPVAEVMRHAFGVQKAMLTTIHSVTAGQNVVDGLPPERKNDLRRARAAYTNIIPTSTGAAIATTEAISDLVNKFDGIAVRVPTIDVSLSDFTFLAGRSVTVGEVNQAFIQAAESERWEGILGVTDEPLVSSDFIGSPYSAVVDLSLTRVVDGDLVKVMAWYDNEWGYSTRLIELAANMGQTLSL